jgi:hypothetical protein
VSKLVDVELNSTYNEYPLYILLIHPQRDKLEINEKMCFLNMVFHVFPVYLNVGLLNHVFMNQFLENDKNQ